MSTVQSPEPLQAPPIPALGEPPAGIGGQFSPVQHPRNFRWIRTLSLRSARIGPRSPAQETLAPTSRITPDPSEAVATRRETKGRRAVWALAAGLLGTLALFGIYRFATGSEQSTDNAMVDGDVVNVSARVGGMTAELRVTENSAVHKGDVLVVLDDAELAAKERQAAAASAAAEAQATVADAQVNVAEAAARGGLSTAEAQVSTSRAMVGSADAQVQSAQADVVRKTAEATRAAADLIRARSLVEGGGGTQQTLDSAVAADASAQAALTGSRAALTAAEDASIAAKSRMAEAGGAVDVNTPVDAKIAVARANAALAHANLDAANAALELARLAHGYATITAPADGVVSRLSARVGQLVSTGQQVATIVPQATYIVANFKETQVAGMRAGQPVDVTVDGVAGAPLHAIVDSVAPGTGSRFSMLAPDNASGNFVKVVQRVPVRMVWKDLPADVTLRPGESVEVTVHTAR